MQKNGNHNSLSDHSTIKLEIKIKKISQKPYDCMEIKNPLLNDYWVSNKKKAKIKFFETNEN